MQEFDDAEQFRAERLEELRQTRYACDYGANIGIYTAGFVAMVEGGRTYEVVRGNPFSGGVDSIEEELRRRTPVS